MCMQLSARVTKKDLEDFFSKAGAVSNVCFRLISLPLSGLSLSLPLSCSLPLSHFFLSFSLLPLSLSLTHSLSFSLTLLKVREVHLISDRQSRRSKGIAYVEFEEESAISGVC